MASTSPPKTTGSLPSSGKKRSADHMRNAEQSCQPGTDDIGVHTELPQAGSGASKDRAVCRVPGCTSTVADETLRNSHRVKLCLVHQKADSVNVTGVEHRFCQQCTRLHPLDLFDGDKRGCRKRLERHNRRRQRKVKMSKLQGSNDESHSTSVTAATGTESYFSAPDQVLNEASREYYPEACVFQETGSSFTYPTPSARMDALLAPSRVSSFLSGHTQMPGIGTVPHDMIQNQGELMSELGYANANMQRMNGQSVALQDIANAGIFSSRHCDGNRIRIAMSHPPNNGFYGMMGNQWMMNQRVSDETENHNMPQMSSGGGLSSGEFGEQDFDTLQPIASWPVTTQAPWQPSNFPAPRNAQVHHTV